MAAVNSTNILHPLFVENKVPTVMHILQETDLAFDLILPKISPSAHNAIYDVERFLVLQIKNIQKPELITEEIKNTKNKNCQNVQFEKT